MNYDVYTYMSSWLTLHENHVIVNSVEYIKNQPVTYEQISDIIDEIRRRGTRVHAIIDISGLRISRVNLFGVVRIIWDLHEETYGEQLLTSLEFIGASPRVVEYWELLKHNLPEFIRILPTKMSSTLETS